jgi:hypothetical protein
LRKFPQCKFRLELSHSAGGRLNPDEAKICQFHGFIRWQIDEAARPFLLEVLRPLPAEQRPVREAAAVRIWNFQTASENSAAPGFNHRFSPSSVYIFFLGSYRQNDFHNSGRREPGCLGGVEAYYLAGERPRAVRRIIPTAKERPARGIASDGGEARNVNRAFF